MDIDPTGKTERQIAEDGIQRLRDIWSSMGAPSRLSDDGIDESKIEDMEQKATDVYCPKLPNHLIHC